MAGGIRWEIVAAGNEPAAKVDSIDTYEWYPGEFFLVHHADSKVGDERIHSIEIIGYDPARKCYVAQFFDSTGGSGEEEIRHEGNTWTWRGSNVMGAREQRCIAVVSDDGNTVSAPHEKSEDGRRWLPWINVTLRRQGA